MRSKVDGHKPVIKVLGLDLGLIGLENNICGVGLESSLIANITNNNHREI